MVKASVPKHARHRPKPHQHATHADEEDFIMKQDRHILTRLTSYLQRILALGMVLLCVMPVQEAMAATTNLSNALWQTTGFCLDTGRKGTEPIEVMTPDARAYQMSIELRALQEMLRVQQEEAAANLAMSKLDEPEPEQEEPCNEGVSADGERAICLPQEVVMLPGTTPEQLEIVAISLLEDIAPLDIPDGPPNSCQASSSSPDRCESSPPFPQRLQLDVTVHGALIQAIAAPSPHAKTRHTLPLKEALPRRLLDERSGHSREEERPPQGAAC